MMSGINPHGESPSCSGATPLQADMTRIDEERAKAGREELVRQKVSRIRRSAVQVADVLTQQVIYGSSVSYRNMCRFNSGFFYRHPLLADYDYYWRVEPDVKFFCDVAYDPFLTMKDNGYKCAYLCELVGFSQANIRRMDDLALRVRAHHPYSLGRDQECVKSCRDSTADLQSSSRRTPNTCTRTTPSSLSRTTAARRSTCATVSVLVVLCSPLASPTLCPAPANISLVKL